MNSIILVLFEFVVFFLGYRFYAHWLSNRIFNINEDITLPAHELRDDVDFLPTKKYILFGHHFTFVAGAAPIIGPCVAAYWGWLPAILWVVFGTVFMGVVHDFGALVVSVKEKGHSIAEISGRILNGRVPHSFSFVYYHADLVGISGFCHGNRRSICCNPIFSAANKYRNHPCLSDGLHYL